MPFIYDLMLHDDEPEYTMKQHLVPAGTLVGTGQAVAVVTESAMDFHLHAPQQGLLVAWLAEDGMRVSPKEAIARIVCEGSKTEIAPVVPQRLG